MPLPKPKKDEKQDDFIERCMSNDTMKKEFPDNDQRLAVCFKQWKEKDSEKKESEMNIERRILPFGEFRVIEDKKETKLTGYAAVFDMLSEKMWGFREKVAKGAFTKTIGQDDVRMLWNYDPNFVLARNKSKTLTLREDGKGLYFEGIVPETQWAKDLVVSIKRGDVSQCSFGFIIEKEEWNYGDGKEEDIRTLKEVKLFDVSPVTYPAYPQTEVHIRSKWGKTVLVYPEIKDEQKKIISNLMRISKEAKENVSQRYGVTDRIFSATEPNPTIYLTDSTGEQEGEAKAKPSFVEPKSKKPLVDPIRMAKYSKYIK